MKLKVLDLFSGIGGFSLAAHRAGMEVVAHCEIEAFPQAVLKYRFPNIPIFNDVKEITKKTFYEKTGLKNVDVVCGGSPRPQRRENVPLCVSTKCYSQNITEDCANTICSSDHKEPQAVCVAENVIGRKPHNGGEGVGAKEEISYTLNALESTAWQKICQSED